ncbi:ompA family protein [Asticcacaulis biprosthecium C19]|uniref:OmpA family protein n=1 Tax=Asticcacaulis biprosthecium C19 TaxID=715226 RepID=F4QRA6_9CAUL|nr:ompA family protein [Asticcacaulis biprosthecium C19]
MGLTGLVALGAVGLYKTLPGVESDVRASVVKALADNGFSDVRAEVSGQTVTLSVGDTVANPVSHLEQAKAVVTKLDGKVSEVHFLSMTEATPVQVAAANPSALKLPTEVIKGEKATTIVATNSNLPAVAGDNARDAAIEVARSCDDRISAAMGKRRLEYRFGTYELIGDSEPLLDELSKVVADCPADVKLIIAGYTDATGDAKANQLISLARAQTAADGLVKRGVDAGRIQVQGMGGAAPVADNATPEGRAANRRIVIRATAG